MHNLLKYLFFLLLMSSTVGCRLVPHDVEEEEEVFMVGDVRIDTMRLQATIDSIIAQDRDTTQGDRATRAHYTETRWLQWITNDGVTPQADSLIAYLERVGDMGFDKKHFFLDEIAEDKERVDSLDFTGENLYSVIARLDIRLTKAFTRYVGGQHYGFTNPYRIFNYMDHDKHDTLKQYFRQLYDVPTKVIGKQGYRYLARLAGTDSTEIALRDAQPRSPLYARLMAMLPDATGEERRRILVNMERCRWRHDTNPWEHSKYIVVNIPSYELLGVDGDSTLEMRIVCGSHDTKTPLVTSHIMRMDLNPQWAMPMSVIKHEIAHHAGNADYFARHRYFITDRKTGERQNPEAISMAQLQSGAYRVTQEGGEGNALGRIIFRFQNNFSIYLHDTSSKGTFSRLDRRASHGCIRVEKPYDLACFLLNDKDETLMDKIKYSMEYITPPEGDTQMEKPDRKRILHSLAVKPQVPLFITYYTMYLMPDGKVHTYPDVYSYDAPISTVLNKWR